MKSFLTIIISIVGVVMLMFNIKVIWTTLDAQRATNKTVVEVKVETVRILDLREQILAEVMIKAPPELQAHYRSVNQQIGEQDAKALSAYENLRLQSVKFTIAVFLAAVMFVALLLLHTPILMKVKR